MTLQIDGVRTYHLYAMRLDLFLIFIMIGEFQGQMATFIYGHFLKSYGLCFYSCFEHLLEDFLRWKLHNFKSAFVGNLEFFIFVS